MKPLRERRALASPLSEPTRTRGARPAELAPLLASEFFIVLANGIAFTAVASRVVEAGLDSWTVGAAGSAYYAGLFSVYLSSPAILGRLGLRWSLLLASWIAAAGVAMLVTGSTVGWLAGRAATGVGVGLLYAALETWINSAVAPSARATALSFYMGVFFAANLGAQAVLLLVAPASPLALAIAGASILVGSALLLLARPPRGRQPATTGLKAFSVPKGAWVGVAGVVTTGLAASAFFALGPVYALSVGFAPEHVAAFSLAVLTGATVMQPLIGRLADRVGPRRLLATLTLMAIATALALVFGRADIATLLIAVLWGGAALTGYALAAALTYAAAQEHPPAHVARVVLTANGLGGVAGPTAASALDVLAPGKGILLLAIVTYSALSVILAMVWALRRS